MTPSGVKMSSDFCSDKRQSLAVSTENAVQGVQVGENDCVLSH